MRRILCMFLLLAGPLVAWPLSAARSAPDPTECTGYPEPRVYLENQSWWEPQKGPPSHPGTGKQGHIHVETCFPLYQRFGATGTIGLDITVRMHNLPGEMKDLRIDSYGDYKLEVANNINWSCPTTDCSRTFHAEVPLDKMRFSGMHALIIEAYVKEVDGRYQTTVPRWPVYLDNGKPLPPPGSVLALTASAIEARGLIGDSWYTNDNPNTGGKYAQVAMARKDLPFDPVTLKDKPVSGIWTPTVFFEADKGFAYIDPALHANPPTKTVAYEGSGNAWGRFGFSRLRIDTRTLTDGRHKLLIGTCNIRILTGDHCGTQVIRFTVKNRPDVALRALRGDTTKPLLSRLRLSSRRFRPGRGTRVSYRLSENAAVKFKVQRVLRGRRVRGRCAAPKRAKKCVRYKTLRGSVRHQGRVGANKLTFKGRIKGRRQSPGRYRLIATATDPAGNRSAPVRTRYIVRR